MDLSMPGMDGVGGDPADQRASYPDAAVLVLTSFSDRAAGRRGVDAGAIGYLLKDTDPVTCSPRSGRPRRGHSPLDPRVARTILRSRRAAPARRADRREEEVLALVGRGLANKQIARALGIREGPRAVHRDGLPGPLALRPRRRRRQPLPRARAHPRPLPRQARDARRRPRHARPPRDPHPPPDRQGREALRRPAPGHRHRPRRRLRPQGPDHGRAHLRPGRGRGRGRLALIRRLRPAASRSC